MTTTKISFVYMTKLLVLYDQDVQVSVSFIPVNLNLATEALSHANEWSSGGGPSVAMGDQLW